MLSGEIALRNDHYYYIVVCILVGNCEEMFIKKFLRMLFCICLRTFFICCVFIYIKHIGLFSFFFP